jgi:hypothetical protein
MESMVTSQASVARGIARVPKAGWGTDGTAAPEIKNPLDGIAGRLCRGLDELNIVHFMFQFNSLF